MKNPLISVIVPVFNGEVYLSECLDSILKQTYENFELIVVNDGSTDFTAQILEDYANRDKRIKMLTQENKGLSGARNSALDQCIGEYITMVDGDDSVNENYLEVLLALAMETKSDIVAASQTANIKKLGLRRESYSIFLPDDYAAQVLYKKLSDNSACGKLYASKLWKTLRYADHYYEDLEIFPKVTLKANQITFTPATLYYYRKNKSGITGKFSPRKIDVLKAVDSVIETVAEYSDNKSLKNAAACRKLSAMFNVLLITAGRKDYAEINEHCWHIIKDLRKQFLLDSQVISKIKIGILLSYLGRNALYLINRLLKISN